MLIAVFRDLYPTHEFHNEIRTTGLSGAAIEYLRNAGMIHQSECLPFRLEPGDNTFSVHARFDDLERDATADRFFLVGHVHHAATAFADLLEEFVTADYGARAFVKLDVNWNGLGLMRTVAGLQEIKFSRVVESREQFVNASPEFAILTAGPEEKAFPGLARGKRNRLFKNLLFPFHPIFGIYTHHR